MKIPEALQAYQNKLTSLYSAEESRSISELIFMHIFGFSKPALFVNHQSETGEQQQQLLEQYLERLLTGEPVQYILGETEFYGLKITVNKNVLIPRPETEELVDWIISDILKNNPATASIQNPDYKLLDIGTGSGCIPIAIKSKIPWLHVEAVDVSEDALVLAILNAESTKVDIKFYHSDILQPSTSMQNVTKYDIIVSNPPYVRKSEMNQMHKNVLLYEPHLALFVDDEDPLLFYNYITDFALNHLEKNGKLYFEINEVFKNNLVELLSQKGFKNIMPKKDMFEKDRMISCSL